MQTKAEITAIAMLALPQMRYECKDCCQAPRILQLSTSHRKQACANTLLAAASCSSYAHCDQADASAGDYIHQQHRCIGHSHTSRAHLSEIVGRIYPVLGQLIGGALQRCQGICCGCGALHHYQILGTKTSTDAAAYTPEQAGSAMQFHVHRPFCCASVPSCAS